MNPGLRSGAIILTGFLLLLIQSAFSVVVPMHPFTPNLMLGMLIFLGVSPDVHITRGAAVSFALGYLLDLFSGNLMGLQTFLSVATFMLARGAGLRLVLRGPGFQAGAAFFVQFLVGGAALALRAIFRDPAPPFPIGGYSNVAWTLIPPAVATAVCAPLIFAIVQRIEGVSVKRQDGATT